MSKEYYGLAGSIFDEPEFRDATDIVVAIYCMLNRDIAGVVPCAERVVATKCRISKKKLRIVLDYFESLGKIIIAPNRSHVWWSSGIFYALFKGKFSDNQLKSVAKTLIKWQNSGVFSPKTDGFPQKTASFPGFSDTLREKPEICEQNFINRVVQLYATKYQIVIPIPKDFDTHGTLSLTHSLTQTHSLTVNSKDIPDKKSPEETEGGPTRIFGDWLKKPDDNPLRLSFNTAWAEYIKNITPELERRHYSIYWDMRVKCFADSDFEKKWPPRLDSQLKYIDTFIRNREKNERQNMAR